MNDAVGFIYYLYKKYKTQLQSISQQLNLNVTKIDIERVKGIRIDNFNCAVSTIQTILVQACLKTDALWDELFTNYENLSKDTVIITEITK